MAGLGEQFYKKLLEVSREVQMPPEYILTVMNMETGLNPRAGKTEQAVGLVQILPRFLKNLGWEGTAQEFKDQPAYGQLEYIKKLILSNMKYNGGPFKSAAQYYVSNFLPLALKLPGVQNEEPNTPIVRKNPTSVDLPWDNTPKHIALEKTYYDSNSGLDADKDGVITYGDLQEMMRKKSSDSTYRAAIDDLRKYTNYSGNVESEEPKPKVDSKEDDYEAKGLFSKYIQKFKDRDFSEFFGSKPDTTTGESGGGVMNVLNNLLKSIMSENNTHRKLCKNGLKSNNFVIEVFADDPVDAIEFSRVMCSALEEVLTATSFTHTDESFVEIDGAIAGPEKECIAAVGALSEAIEKAFKKATKKIGGVDIHTNVIFNKKSSLKRITITAAESNYRKFMLKIA